jgi:S-adenosylmethionine:tRNA-ribosyltransferase-isomerase (queuine synthetase)
MSLFQPSNRQAFKAHAHVAGDLCPLCDQPIAQDIARKIEAKKREQYQAALDQARAEAAAGTARQTFEERFQFR